MTCASLTHTRINGRLSAAATDRAEHRARKRLASPFLASTIMYRCELRLLVKRTRSGCSRIWLTLGVRALGGGGSGGGCSSGGGGNGDGDRGSHRGGGLATGSGDWPLANSSRDRQAPVSAIAAPIASNAFRNRLIMPCSCAGSRRQIAHGFRGV